MATKRKELSDLQRDLLKVALQAPKNTIWLPKAAQQTFPTTYAALVSLQRRGYLAADQGKDPEVLSWTVTKEGRETLKTTEAETSPPKQAAPAPVSTPATKTSVAVAPARKAAPAQPAAPKASPQGATGKASPAVKPSPTSRDKAPSAPAAVHKKVRPETLAPAPSRSSRPAVAAKAEAPRERGSTGKAAVPAASPSRTAGKKALPSAKKSGGRGRT